MTFVLAATLMVTVALLGLFWWGQERMVFQPPAHLGDQRVEGRLDYTARDGQRLFGILIGQPRADAGLLIVFHGNADVAVNQVAWARELHDRTGWRVLLAEYRGYGGAGGRPTADGVRLDARAAWDAANALSGSDVEPIALYGHSLGTAVAVELAAALADAAHVRGDAAPVHALLLESPFTSARDMADRMGPHGTLLFRGGLSRFRWDTEAHVRDVPVRVAVAHGERDGIVPVIMARRVHQAAAVPGSLLIVPEAGHNDVAWHAGEEYWRWLVRALAPLEMQRDF